MSDFDSPKWLTIYSGTNKPDLINEALSLKQQLTETEQALIDSKAREGRYKDALEKIHQSLQHDKGEGYGYEAWCLTKEALTQEEQP